MARRSIGCILARCLITAAVCALLVNPALAYVDPEYNPVVRELGERILTLGSWGADVFELQQSLIRLGYDVAADGLYGKETQRAVLSLQVANGLPSDGIAGPSTLTALRSLHGTIEYSVQPGDSLWLLAQRFDTTMEDIYTLNRLQSSVLRIGQKLQIPAPPTYTVQAGDTLSAIAVRFQTTVQELIALNNIVRPDRLQVGQELRLPRSSR